MLIVPQTSRRPGACRPMVIGGLALLFTLWSGVTACKMLVKLSPALQDVKSLVAYPCVLMYGSFALLTSY